MANIAGIDLKLIENVNQCAFDTILLEKRCETVLNLKKKTVHNGANHGFWAKMTIFRILLGLSWSILRISTLY